jgi:pimeloyl-ACP methyl ester carboxylesterase
MKKLLLFAIVALTVSVLFSSCSKDHDSVPVISKTYVIVPGAFQGPWAWQSVKSGLEAQGQKVIVVQLAGHEKDNTDPATIDMDVYKKQVVDAINGTGGKVILVGHSLGGMVVADVAEQIPSKIDRLVYLAAYVPASGQSLLDLAQTDAGSLLGPNLTFPSPITLDVNHDQILNIFIQDGTSAIKNQVLANWKIEPEIPFTNPVTLTTANYGSVSKYYIHTAQDHAISPDLQNRMVTAAGIKSTFSLSTGHSPFLSKPDSVTSLLIKIGK